MLFIKVTMSIHFDPRGSSLKGNDFVVPDVTRQPENTSNDPAQAPVGERGLVQPELIQNGGAILADERRTSDRLRHIAGQGDRRPGDRGWPTNPGKRDGNERPCRDDVWIVQHLIEVVD